MESASWETDLLDDVRQLIMSFMDPLCRELMRLTCKAHYAPPRYGVMQEVLYGFGTLELVKKVTTDWEYKHMSLLHAARNGNLGVLRWLQEQGHSVYATTLEFAAFGGHLPTVQWLRSLDVCYTKQTLQQAVVGGSAEVVEWLLDDNCPMPFSMYFNAAEEGHIDVIMCLYKRGYPLLHNQHTARMILALVTPPRTALMAVLRDEILADLLFWQ